MGITSCTSYQCADFSPNCIRIRPLFSNPACRAMKRCTAALPTTRSWQARRWASHDRSTLTPEALLEQVQSGLDEDTKIIPDQKKVSTPAGELPLSPVFDPAWIKSRRRERKPAGAPVSGRFRKKLVLNPYARALAQPLRVCSMTNATLPRY